MKTFCGVSEDGEAVAWTDHKRWLWALSVLYPLQPLVGIWLHATTGNEWWLGIGILTSYVAAPVIDALLGEDDSNPPESVVMELDRDPYYRYLTWFVVPLHAVTLVVSAGYAATAGLSWAGFLGLAIVSGMTAGLAINTGHELGHKNSGFEKALARISLAIPAYGHFTLDHNRGHHAEVATPDDPASARMGESIYRFAAREIPGVFQRAWRFEVARLAKRGRPAWHPDNRLLQTWGLSAAVAVALVVAFGWSMLLFLLVHHAFAYFQLTSANYIEHYGLLRERREDGRYEACAPHHSWNSNHVLSNLVLFHLERHSDHHANPLRRYQSLRHHDNLPRLPNGYFGSYLLAYLPALWFRVMDPRLLSLPHIGGDLSKINICPRARERIEKTYG